MRIRNTCLLLLSLFFTHYLSAQSGRSDLHFTPGKAPGWHSPMVSVPLQHAEPFLAVSLAWKGESRSFGLRFSTDGQRWGDWVNLGLDAHGEQSPERYISELYFADATSRYVQFRAAGPVEQLQAHFYNPGLTEDKKDSAEGAIGFRGPAYCPCPQPDYEGRGDWCPDGNCPADATPTPTNVTHLIVHHSAGTNEATDWAAVVRSIWDFHVFVRGWDDIGYNWLVDPDGVIYEGRGDNVLGAHFCGTNGGTMGVCVLGDFTSITPTMDALDNLRELLAWKACDAGIDPLEKAVHASSGFPLDNISGHRDGCPTECPGNAFYPLLNDLRDSVASYIASSCAPIATPQQLTATAVSETEALLEWTDGSDNETAFLIERSGSFNGDYEPIGSVEADVTAYTDTGLEPQSGYYYRIRSANEQDTSAYSNRAFVFLSVVKVSGPLGAEYVRVFPNPAGARLAVTLDSELNGAVQVRLLTSTGREAWRTVMNGGHWRLDVPVAGLPQGLYLLQLRHGKTAAAYKVVLE